MIGFEPTFKNPMEMERHYYLKIAQSPADETLA
jgi:hypothetical protein